MESWNHSAREAKPRFPCTGRILRNVRRKGISVLTVKGWEKGRPAASSTMLCTWMQAPIVRTGNVSLGFRGRSEVLGSLTVNGKWEEDGPW